MEKAIANELSLCDLEIVSGGAKTHEYDMNGDHYVCKSGECTRTTSNSTSGVGQTVVAWFKSLF